MNIPHYKQELEYSCLPACLRMVLAFYGVEISEKELRIVLRTRMGGTSPVRVMLALPALGFNAYVLDGSQELIKFHLTNGQPCIVHLWTEPLPHWDIEAIHADVLTDFDGEGVQAYDPAYQYAPVSIPWINFMRAWAAVDHLMYSITPTNN